MIKLNWNMYPDLVELRNRKFSLVEGDSLISGDVILSQDDILYIVESVTGNTILALDQDGIKVHGQKEHDKDYQVVFNRALSDKYVESLILTGVCPPCRIKLEWASMAERCPNCWKVYVGGCDA